MSIILFGFWLIFVAFIASVGWFVVELQTKQPEREAPSKEKLQALADEWRHSLDTPEEKSNDK